MKEIKFYFNFDNYKIIFDDGNICDIDSEKNLELEYVDVYTD